MWQDKIIALASIMFAYALAVQVYHGFKKKTGLVYLQTSTIFTLDSMVLAYVFYTLNLFLHQVSV